MTEALLLEEVAELLGDQFIKIELLSSHWEKILNRTYRWYAARKGVTKKCVLSLVPNTNAYALPSDFKAVTEYVPMRQTDSPFNPDAIIFDDTIMAMQGYSSHGLVDVAIQQEYNAILKKTVGSDYGYRIEEYNMVNADSTSGDMMMVSMIHVEPTPQVAGQAFVYYTSSEMDGKYLPALKPVDTDILVNVCEAYAKLTLGRIRSKFGDLQVPGGSVTLDGTTLIDEANTTLAAMETRLYDSQDPMVFVLG